MSKKFFHWFESYIYNVYFHIRSRSTEVGLVVTTLFSKYLGRVCCWSAWITGGSVKFL